MGSIAKQLERDLSVAERENSYITDPTAIVLRSAASELDRCNISPRISDDSIDRLAWFVGGNAEKIRQLQRKLNELNITDRLTEDGVYGKKTATAWIRFINVLSHGTLPTLLYVDPLKSSFDPLRENSEYTFSIRSSREGKNNAIANAKTGHHYFRIDPPHFDKNGNPQKGYYRGQKVDLDYNHLNVNFGNSPSRIEAWFNYRYNHQPLTSRQYDALKDLSKFGKTIRIEGRTLLIDGAFFDAFELGLALYEDLNDADRKLGQTFLSTSCGIVGGSLGGAAGAKIGAALGTLTGPLAPIAAPIFAIAGGVIGSYTGDSLFRYLVDISYLEE